VISPADGPRRASREPKGLGLLVEGEEAGLDEGVPEFSDLSRLSKLNEVFLGNWGQQLVPKPKLRTFVRLFTLSAARIYQSGGLFTSTASISCLVYPIASPHTESGRR
jgi:hypothetical protein